MQNHNFTILKTRLDFYYDTVMNTIASQIYRILVPKFIRKRLLAKKLPISILNYYASLPETPTSEIESVLNYLRRNPMSVFPYDFQNHYIAGEIEVHYDQNNGIRYVMHEGKKLYFKKRWGIKKIRNLYNLLLKEQDIRSPHRYLDGQFSFDEGEMLVDVGTAEGNFALSIVEKASRLILFEADREWIEPLNATFEPWKDKVTIVNKFVGDVTGKTSTTLDDFFPARENSMFLKIDVEGAESRLFKGAAKVLSEQRPLKVVVCAYHKQDDEKEFNALLTENNFETSHSGGFMLFYFDKKMKAPYFRRGLIRAVKK